VIEHLYKQNKNILMTQPSNVPSLEVYSLAASEPNKPRNCLWSADVNINASLHLVILFKSMASGASGVFAVSAVNYDNGNAA
jgi:hypothetical protein